MGIIGLLLSIISYGSPINYEMVLAGNFGEPRPNHFHGGLDIKTEQVEGKLIHAIGDGFVSRVTIDLDGFGNAIYVQHPEGYTSIYAHLKRFTPQIEAVVKKWQYKYRSSTVDVRLRPYDLPVAQGQLIALSGNTGASQAPHLHLEIHDTKTWDMLDPLDFLSTYVKDDIPPVAHAFMAYPQTGKGLFNGETRKQSFPFTTNHLKTTFTAWGEVGFALRADDYMLGSNGNKYGIRHTRLLIDGNEIFQSNVDRIPVNYNRMVNSWGDYELYTRLKVWYMKSFRDPGNLLPIIMTNENRGIFNFNEERDYQVQYILTDYFGNSSKYGFVVRGKKATIPKDTICRSKGKTLFWNRKNLYKENGVLLLLKKGLLAQNIELSSKSAQLSEYSNIYSFSDNALPLFDWGTISLRLQKPVSDTGKLYVVCHSHSDMYMGGEYKDGWVSGRIRDLNCQYEILYDDVPPTITTSFSLGSPVITAYIEDEKSGIANFEGYLDGQFVLFSRKSPSGIYICDLRQTPVLRTGKLRKMVLKARDQRLNEKNIVIQIKY